MVLLFGAGLLLRSFLTMQRVDLGFRTEGVAFASIAFPQARYREPSRFSAATDDLLARLRANPAVRTVEVTDLPPLTPNDQDISVIPIGKPVSDRTPAVWYRSVTPGYLAMMQMRLVAGRQFTSAETQGAPRVGIMNEEAARQLWPGESPVGRTVSLGAPNEPPVTIVGVVASGLHDGPNQPTKPELFAPQAQFPTRAVTLVLEPSRDLAAVGAAVRQALREVDPLIPAPTLEPIEQRVGDAVALPRLYAILVGLFASAALSLAALGVYGVMAYTVTQRRREIGVRVALGADPAGIRRLVLGRGARLAVAGLAIGLVAALALGRLIRALLYGVTPFDAATLLAVPVVLGVMTMLASWVPARRAMRLDPVTALREE